MHIMKGSAQGKSKREKINKKAVIINPKTNNTYIKHIL